MVKCRASTVVEMAYLMPVVLLMWMLVIFALFYYHDKNIISGAAYETAVAGSEWYHEQKHIQENGKEGGEEDQELSEEKLVAYFQKRIRGKMIFFGQASVEIEKTDQRILVKAEAGKRRMAITVEKGAALTVPEEEIRKIRVLKQWGKDLVE